MPQSLGKMYAHVLFSTRGQSPLLIDAKVREELHAYITGICSNWLMPSVRTGGVQDHVHILLRLSREGLLSRVVREVMVGSSDWLQSRYRMLSFEWADDYAAFSVSPTHVEAVGNYIDHQEKRHGRMSFQEEMKGILFRTPQPSSLNQVYVHVVFTTKNRTPFLMKKTVREELYRFMTNIGMNWEFPALRIGGVEDHVHILGMLPREYPIARLVQELKKNSTNWLKRQHQLDSFDWQDGYGAFSVSPPDVGAVIRYIERQEEHHHRGGIRFEDETERILEYLDSR